MDTVVVPIRGATLLLTEFNPQRCRGSRAAAAARRRGAICSRGPLCMLLDGETVTASGLWQARPAAPPPPLAEMRCRFGAPGATTAELWYMLDDNRVVGAAARKSKETASLSAGCSAG
jgi:hypothetical protein